MEPLAKSLLAEDVIEKVDAHSFFMGGPDHEIVKRQVKTGKKVGASCRCSTARSRGCSRRSSRSTPSSITVSPMDKARLLVVRHQQLRHHGGAPR